MMKKKMQILHKEKVIQTSQATILQLFNKKAESQDKDPRARKMYEAIIEIATDNQAELPEFSCSAHNIQLVINDGRSSQRAVLDIIVMLESCASHFDHSVLANIG